MCLLARTSSIKSAFLFLCFPGFREEPEKSLKDRTLSDHEGNAFPIIAIEFIGSSVLDTLVLPYTIYRQNKDGSIEIFR